MELMSSLYKLIVILSSLLSVSAFPQGEALKPCGDAFYYPSQVRLRKVSPTTKTADKGTSTPATTATSYVLSSMANLPFDVALPATFRPCTPAVMAN